MIVDAPYGTEPAMFEYGEVQYINTEGGTTTICYQWIQRYDGPVHPISNTYTESGKNKQSPREQCLAPEIIMSHPASSVEVEVESLYIAQTWWKIHLFGK